MRLDFAITDPVSCARSAGAGLDVGKSDCKLLDQGQPWSGQMHSQLDCRQPGQLVIDCKKQKLQKKAKKNGR
jgi:hypothetical protein